MLTHYYFNYLPPPVPPVSSRSRSDSRWAMMAPEGGHHCQIISGYRWTRDLPCHIHPTDSRLFSQAGQCNTWAANLDQQVLGAAPKTAKNWLWLVPLPKDYEQSKTKVCIPNSLMKLGLYTRGILYKMIKCNHCCLEAEISRNCN